MTVETQHNAKILLCEDDQNLGLVLKNYLELNDYNVVLERDGRLGLAAFQREKFDLCLLDVMMPHVDGFEFLKILSEHAMFSSLTIVAITGMSAKEIHTKGGLPDGVQLLQKPIDLEWLRGFFDALLSMRQANRRTRG
jgi:DNA-binding response OmpR family regulator